MFLLLDIFNSPNNPLPPAITCPGVPIPNNGTIDFGGASRDENGTYIFAVVATYSCDTGFSLVGDNTRTCTGDGSSTTGVFDGIATICAGRNLHNIRGVVYYRLFSTTAITCPPLSNLTNGSVSYSNVPGQNNSYAFNVEATYSCDTGFSLVDNNTRTCTGDGSSTTGSFNGEAPTCEGELMKTLNCIYTLFIIIYSYYLPSSERSLQRDCDLQC